MKHFGKMMMGMILVLAMVMGAMALAETVPAEPPTLEEAAPAEQTPADAPAEAANDNTALQEALKAYREARQADRQAEQQSKLEEELKDYVEAGKLTQEQADLILNEYKTRAEQRAAGKANGQFGKGGRMNGCMGGYMNGQNGMNGQFGRGGRMNGQNNGMNGRMGGMGKGGRMGGMNPMDGNSSATPKAEAEPQSVNDGI